MRLANEMRIARPPAEVLAALLDMQRVAECLPVGRLTGRAGDARTGEVTVRVGPVRAAYTGTVRYLEADRERRRVVVRARGTERDGQGDADARVVVTLRPDGDGTVVSLDTDLTVRGRVAQFGRSALAELADDLTTRFATNLERHLIDVAPGHPEPADHPERARTGGRTRPAEMTPRDGRRPAAGPRLRRAAAPVATVLTGVVLGILLARRIRRDRPPGSHLGRYR